MRAAYSGAVEEDPNPLSYERHPHLDGGLMVLAFGGWNDAGEAASNAVAYLAETLDADEFVSISCDPFYDFQQVRPIVTVEDGLVRSVTWPRMALSVVEDTPRPLVLGAGFEPQFRWREFSRILIDVARDCGLDEVLFLGSLLADVPHTRPSPLVGTASSESLRLRLGLEGANYTGPTGIVGAAAKEFAEAGFEVASCWASASHYVSATPNPNAQLELVRKVSLLCGLDLGMEGLRGAAREWSERVDEAMQEHPDVVAYVQRLEEQADAAADSDGDVPRLRPEDLVTGEELADELQRFLRSRPPDA